MTLIVFIPALLCILALLRWGPRGAFLNVCLPILILCPTYFYWKTGGFPALDFGMTVFLPLGVYLFWSHVPRWRFSRADAWLAVYIFTFAFADLKAGQTSLAKYRLFNVVVMALIPYMAGKVLIEQPRARIATARRIVGLLCLTCVLSIPEFFIKLNLFVREWIRFFPGEWPGWQTQMRWGFARVAGPYGSAELFGMILIFGWILSLWLRMWSSAQHGRARFPWTSHKLAALFALALLTLTLYMTQSRGPWLGAFIAISAASVGRAKNVVRQALIVGALALVVGIPAYTAFQSYSSGPRTNYGSERETAQYRAQLLDNYLPLAKAGGAWGWGQFYPEMGGQASVDNEFLRVYLSQGYVGVVAFILIFAEASYSLLRVGLGARSRQNRHFSFSMLGIVLGWAFTLSTVYLGLQSYQLFFLLIGWSQAIPLMIDNFAKQRETVTHTMKESPELTRVYT